MVVNDIGLDVIVFLAAWGYANLGNHISGIPARQFPFPAFFHFRNQGIVCDDQIGFDMIAHALNGFPDMAPRLASGVGGI